MRDDFGICILARAQSRIGVPFRLHGRSAESGFDCIGLVADALCSVGFNLLVPLDYTIRGEFDARIFCFFGATCFKPLGPTEIFDPGDLSLVRTAPRQLHLLIHSAGGFIHAHAGLRRVVMTPGHVPWPVIGRWRYIGG